MDRDDKGLSDSENRDEPTIEDLLKSHNFEKRLEEARAMRQKALERRRQSGVVTSTGVLLRPVQERSGPRPVIVPPNAAPSKAAAGQPAEIPQDDLRQVRMRPSRDNKAPMSDADDGFRAARTPPGNPVALTRVRIVDSATTVAAPPPLGSQTVGAPPATVAVGMPALAAKASAPSEPAPAASPQRSRPSSTLVASSFAFGLGLSIGIAGLAIYRLTAGTGPDAAPVELVVSAPTATTTEGTPAIDTVAAATPDPVAREAAPALSSEVAPFALASNAENARSDGAPLTAIDTPARMRPAPPGIASPLIDATPAPLLRVNSPTLESISLGVAALGAVDPGKLVAPPLMTATAEPPPVSALRHGSIAPSAPAAGSVSVDPTPAKPVVLLASLAPDASMVVPGPSMADAPYAVPTPDTPDAKAPEAGFAVEQPDTAPRRSANPPPPQAASEPRLPGASSYSVRVNVARGAPEADVPQAMASLADLGLDLREPSRTNLNVRTSQVRFFHSEDAPAAAIMAEALGAQARDFTTFTPRPPRGEFEVWLGGTADPAGVAAEPAPRAARVTQRNRPPAVSEADRARALRDQLVRRLRQGDHL